ncbi:tryptophan synthase subunit alpha [Thermoflavimicrobium daqui]|uniref:Tryptophan synthase alpha chain n=1 Tax=Thermoflavimicrobium daqui TaxID=2137476 RepID=A0A364K2T1_9BACL|nr:tryptophan synthase subunit alpha [Thermoflavimicrobium daqui]RAL22725.1 tryptophan synthase subunit alpha [Thermoflavimicrobium daqui]
MNRLASSFEENANPRIIPFMMTGDPHLEVTVELIIELGRAGVTAIELGVPFSDPTADGPVIQAASERALHQQITCYDVLQVGKAVRDRGCNTPLILFSYLNPLLQYGLQKLLQDASEIGFDGLIIPDLPYEESSEIRELCMQYGIPLILFVAPTTKQRIEQIVKESQGFVYCVSSLGTTGIRSQFAPEIASFLQTVKEKSPLPVAVGFGVATPKHVAYFSQYVDAVIVGSALVQLIHEKRESLLDLDKRSYALQDIIKFVKELRK